MRTTKITNYLLRQGYLYLYEERKCPTTKGKMIGIIVCMREVNSILIVAIAVKTVFRRYGVGMIL